MSELKACPFCGTSVVGIEHDGLYRWVECGNMDCNAAGKVFAFLTDVGNADHIVANNWNTRPIEDKLTAELARRDELIKHKEEVIGHIEEKKKTVFELLSNTIKRRNKKIAEQADIIARLKEDAERLAVLENAYGTKRINALNLHKQLMKELEC